MGLPTTQNHSMNNSSAILPLRGADVWLLKRRTTIDQQAEFERLVALEWPRFWRFAYRLTGNRDNAEDLLSETLLDAYSCFGRYRGDGFHRWFFKMLANNHVDMVRKAKRRPVESLDTTFSESAGRELADPTMGPERHVVEAVYSEPVQAALDSLSLDYRTVVLLCDVEGYDYAEAAGILGIPIGTVRSRLSRGRERLRQALQEAQR